MIQVLLQAFIQETAPAVFARLCDFSKYAALTETVRKVEVTPLDEHTASSDWSINFRGGILEWREHDDFDPRGLEIRFRQLSGDLKSFSGCWKVTPSGSGASVEFRAEADLGIPSLAPLLEPAAERALTQAIEQILVGLFGPALSFVPPSAAAAE